MRTTDMRIIIIEVREFAAGFFAVSKMAPDFRSPATQIEKENMLKNYGFNEANVLANSGSTIVCARSGPVETIPIFAPDSRS